LGVVSAARHNSWVDHLSRGVSVAGVSMPLFWLGLVALALLYGKMGWLPGSGRLAPFTAPPPPVTGLYLIDAARAPDRAAWLRGLARGPAAAPRARLSSGLSPRGPGGPGGAGRAAGGAAPGLHPRREGVRGAAPAGVVPPRAPQRARSRPHRRGAGPGGSAGR